jgi:hypothetical protein
MNEDSIIIKHLNLFTNKNGRKHKFHQDKKMYGDAWLNTIRYIANKHNR